MEPSSLKLTEHCSINDNDSIRYRRYLLSDSSNRWGIKNLHTHLSEWCLDWHGIYTAHDQVDPVGPAYGIAKVVCGSGLDRKHTGVCSGQTST